MIDLGTIIDALQLTWVKDFLLTVVCNGQP